VNLRRSTRAANLMLDNPIVSSEDRSILDQMNFHRIIAFERKRTERSGKPFLLVLLDMGECLPMHKSEKLLTKTLSALSSSIRETDVTGWYEENSVVGIVFTEIIPEDKYTIVGTMLSRISTTLRDNLSFEQFGRVSISLHLYPEDWNHELPRQPKNPALYPDISKREEGRRLLSSIKRVIDIVGSVAALIVFSPLFLLIAIAIKLTSKGPVFFHQERVGQFGKPFVLLKFRSMSPNNDAKVHQEWFSKFVSGRGERQSTGSDDTGVFKLVNDPRVTRMGRLLRRSSLDELPQFINVLKGDMSLVGPRPPIPYEVHAYLLWHRGRVLEAKPGITGLWQVNGRSRVTFDEMVRLDIRYARTWSIWLDIKILLKTPRAVLLGDGAY
jgi:lipopolysaccharide/colanic/teichoic acid biosynthesis glycosyltransferase